MNFIKLMALGCLICLMSPATVLADAVTNYNSKVTVTSDNIVNVTETIAYDPEGVPHHGIFRFVPAQFSDQSLQKYYTSIIFGSVTDPEGKPYNIASSHNNSQELYLKIGDPSLTFTDPHTYIIKYAIRPLVIRSGDHDRLLLNITGQQWDTNIDQVSATFQLPVKVLSAQCFTGISGSTANDCLAQTDGQTATITTTKPLQPSEGLTADLDLPPNSFTTYLQPNVRRPLTKSDKLSFGLSGLAAALVIVSLIIEISQQLKAWLARRRQTIIAQYEPPDNLRPAQVGSLDKRGQRLENITSTIIDLAARGYITIELIRPKGVWRQADYKFTKVKDFTELTDFEQSLANGMFTTTDTGNIKHLFPSFKTKAVKEVKLSELKHSMTSALASFNNQVGNSLKIKGYFYASPTTGAWGTLLVMTIVASQVAAGVSIGHDPRQPLAGFVALLLAMAAAIVSLKHTGLSKAGTTEWAEIEGFKLFLKVTEKDRLKFFNDPKNLPPKLTAKMFSTFLPYAIALKVEKQWAKQFEGIDVSQAVGSWYIASAGANFSAIDFGSSLGGAFSSAVSGSFAGSSGGGSAGGGGGGGGGGGW